MGIREMYSYSDQDKDKASFSKYKDGGQDVTHALHIAFSKIKQRMKAEKLRILMSKNCAKLYVFITKSDIKSTFEMEDKVKILFNHMFVQRV